MTRRPSRQQLPLLLVALLTPWQLSQAQQTTTASSSDAGAPIQIQQGGSLQLVGSDARLGIGWQNRGGLTAELSGVLKDSGDQAWLGELWLNDQAGGLQLSYHFLSGETVYKSFLAYDRNQQHDQKYTLGIGRESSSWFGNLYASYGASSRRLLSTTNTSGISQQAGSDSNGNYLDTITTVTQTSLYERAYDYGVGARVGHYYADQQVRLSAGIDHEWGQSNARQTGVNLSAEKYFLGTPHSIALQLAQYRKSGQFEERLNDHRISLFYRYNLGGTPSGRYQEQYRMIPEQSTRLETTTIPARSEHKLVKTSISMDADAFFELASYQLSEAARAELDKIAALIKQQQLIGQISIVGHTCDLGSTRFNLKLSQQRAAAVRDYLVQAGAIQIADAQVSGKGSADPKFPAKPATRAKNRRVDLSFVSSVEQDQVTEIPAQTISKEVPVVSYRREDIAQQPAWIKAALRSPAEHKRSIDVYRSQQQTQTSTSSRTYLNRPPQAGNVSASTQQNQPVTIDVLSHASDPDGNTLSISAVGNAGHGSVQIQGQKLLYTPATDYVGNDQFSFTVSDGHGATATAQVSISISAAVAPKPNHDPVARNDVFSISSHQPSMLDVLANDSDPDGDTLTIVSLSQPTHGIGAVSIVNNKVLFTPSGTFFADTFQYTISDGRGGTATATVLLVDP